MQYLVKGLSIDGTVYSNGFGWNCNRQHLRGISLRIAQDVIEQQKKRNTKCDLDNIIGRLRIVNKFGKLRKRR